MSKPKEGQKCWVIGGELSRLIVVKFNWCKLHEDFGYLPFRTKREAEKVKRKIERLLKNTWR